MSKPMHTPGPWKSSDRYVFQDNLGDYTRGSQQVACTTELTAKNLKAQETFRQEAIANARLIAAAPDMLDALMEIIAEWDKKLLNDTGGILLARDAIAKAQGGAK